MPIIKLERETPSPTNSVNYDQYNYNIKISNPISWALNPKSELFQTHWSEGSTPAPITNNKLPTIITPTSTTTNKKRRGITGSNNTSSHSTNRKSFILSASRQQRQQHQFMKSIDLKFCKVKREPRNSSGGGGGSSNENMLYMPNDDKPWICKGCNRNYKWKNSLKCHLKNECGLPPKYYCMRNCGYKTNIHSNLKRHLNSKFCKPPDENEKVTL